MATTLNARIVALISNNFIMSPKESAPKGAGRLDRSEDLISQCLDLSRAEGSVTFEILANLDDVLRGITNAGLGCPWCLGCLWLILT